MTARVKNVAFGLCTLTILAFILYIPVLIWSPWWGANGIYYSDNDESTVISFQNGIYRVLSPKVSGNKKSVELVFSIDRWVLESEGKFAHQLIEVAIGDGTIVVNDILHIEQFADESGSDVEFIKTINPFKIWKIKIEEWIN